MPRKVLVVSYYFPPFNGPVTQHAQWLLKYLPEHGLEPHVLSSSVFFGENAGAPPIRSGVHSIPDGARARRVAVALGKLEMYLQVKARLWDLGFGWAAAYGLRAGVELLRGGDFVGIVSVSPSISSHWLAWRLKRSFPALTWIADFTDPFVDNPFRNTPPALRDAERRLERALFVAADHLAANTEQVRLVWADRYPELQSRMFVMPNGFDPEERIEPLPIPPRDVPTLAHVGAVYGGRLPNALFDALYELVEAGRLAPGSVCVEFLGSTSFDHVQRPERLRALRDRGIVRVRDVQVPRREALDYAARADSLLVLDITEPHDARLQLPSKLFDCIRIGRPILAFTGADSPTESVLSSSGIPHRIIHNRRPIDEVKDGLVEFLRAPRADARPSPWILQTFDARAIVRSAAERLLGAGARAGTSTLDLAAAAAAGTRRAG
jgi:glycosyltransferase involved in cell wall biosynthesis